MHVSELCNKNSVGELWASVLLVARSVFCAAVASARRAQSIP